MWKRSIIELQCVPIHWWSFRTNLVNEVVLEYVFRYQSWPVNVTIVVWSRNPIIGKQVVIIFLPLVVSIITFKSLNAPLIFAFCANILKMSSLISWSLSYHKHVSIKLLVKFKTILSVGNRASFFENLRWLWYCPNLCQVALITIQ